MKSVAVWAAALMCLCASVTAGSHAYAQDVSLENTGAMHGIVTAGSTGLALPYAIITIVSLKLDKFTDERGQFVFTRLPVGTYHLRVRQVGYVPRELDVTVTNGPTLEVSIQLTRLAQKLTAMSVTTDWQCTKTGRPKNAGAETLAIFEQLEQSATRMRLLQNQFPYEVHPERWIAMRSTTAGDSLVRQDTILLAKSGADTYKPGRVIYTVVKPNRVTESYIQIPTLLDIADEEFQKNHCFLVRGVDTKDNPGKIRIDFKAAEKIHTPDVEGSVYLDSATYKLQSAQFRLTSVPRYLVGTQHVTITTTYGEISQGLPVVAGIHAITDLNERLFGNNYYQRVEEQTPVEVRFLNTRPGSPN